MRIADRYTQDTQIKMKFIDRPELEALLAKPYPEGQGPILIDVASADTEETLSGAHRVDFDRIVLNRDNIAGLLPDIEDLNEALAHTGISPDRPIVLFDAQNGLAASRLAWTLVLGGFEKIYLLNGGRAALTSMEGRLPVPPEKPAKSLRYDLSRHHTQAEDIAAARDQWLIVDARSTDEFVGKDRRSKHAGHIPGALHFDWSWCFDPAKPGYLLPDAELLAKLAEHGISPSQSDRPIAVYCQSHRRSSLLFCVLKHLGFNDVRGYPGAWSDWGNRDDVPISCPQNPAADQPK